MPEVLHSEVSPNGNLEAVLESDSRTCFLYLCGSPDSNFGVRSVWIRNLIDAPTRLDLDSVKEGNPPVMPVAHCRNPAAQTPPDPDSIRFVWLPEGNGVAVLESDEIIGIIPPWSGTEGFDGYAKDCVGESPFAWELTEDNALHDRFRLAQEYWDVWERGEIWNETQDAQISALEKTFGEQTNYYAIDNSRWPPKAMLRFRSDQWQVLATIGVSLQPQPNVERYFQDPSPQRRIELAVALPADASDDAINRIGQYLSAQSGMPWVQQTFLGSGHTIPCDSWPDENHTFSLLVDECPLGLDVVLPPVFGDNVNLLWFIPITEAEREIAVNETSDKLRSRLPADRWRSAHTH